MRKRILSLATALALCLGLMVVPACAQETDVYSDDYVRIVGVQEYLGFDPNFGEMFICDAPAQVALLIDIMDFSVYWEEGDEPSIMGNAQEVPVDRDTYIAPATGNEITRAGSDCVLTEPGVYYIHVIGKPEDIYGSAASTGSTTGGSGGGSGVSGVWTVIIREDSLYRDDLITVTNVTWTASDYDGLGFGYPMKATAPVVITVQVPIANLSVTPLYENEDGYPEMGDDLPLGDHILVDQEREDGNIILPGSYIELAPGEYALDVNFYEGLSHGFCFYYLIVNDPATTTSGGSHISAWAKEVINAAEREGLVPEWLIGTDLTRDITRADFAAAAVGLYKSMGGSVEGLSLSNPYSDVTPDMVACDDILLAKAIGIASGKGDGIFDPGGTLTREEAGVMLLNTYLALGYVIDLPGATGFADNASISSWAVPAVAFLNEKGVLSGVGDNRFAPQSETTGEEALTMALSMLYML